MVLALGMLPAVSGMAQPQDTGKEHVVVTRIEPEGKAQEVKQDEAGAWLGLGTDEVPDVLSAQLKLKAGEGLVVSFVASNSPAATAGLAKNDLLLRWEDQVLVHPEQLRKLVRNSKPGDEFKLTVLQGGDRREVSVTLAKAPPGFAPFGSDSFLPREWRELGRDLANLPLHEEMRHLRENLARAGIDRETLTRDIAKNVEEARKALQQAMRTATNHLNPASDAVARMMKDLARARVNLDKQVSVSVHNTARKVQTLVQTDDTGTYTLIADPKPRITIHDGEGKLVFDGPVTTPEEIGKVPEDYRERVQSMVDKLDEDKKSEQEVEE